MTTNAAARIIDVIRHRLGRTPPTREQTAIVEVASQMTQLNKIGRPGIGRDKWRTSMRMHTLAVAAAVAIFVLPISASAQSIEIGQVFG